MATKSSYLTLINKILKRVNQSVITSIPTTGHAAIIGEFLNEGQNELYTKANWYSLYTPRFWKTYKYTASTIAFNDANPDTITDSANGLGSFTAGETIRVDGSTDNDGVYVIGTAAAGTLTLTSDEQLTAEIAGDSVTITKVTYALASGFGKMILLKDVTNNKVLTEDIMRAFETDDPDQDTLSNPTHFGVQGNYIRPYPIPSGAYKMREWYLKTPTALSATTDTSDLPIECENPLIWFAWYNMLAYLQKYDEADRKERQYLKMVEDAKAHNAKVVDQWHRMMGADNAQDGIAPPRFPSAYGARYY